MSGCRVIRVARSISKAPPKLFDMKATRLPSGDQTARSPKSVRRVMFGGRLSSGLPVRVACAVTRRGTMVAQSATMVTAMMISILFMPSKLRRPVVDNKAFSRRTSAGYNSWRGHVRFPCTARSLACAAALRPKARGP
jgi:hypothetical protein